MAALVCYIVDKKVDGYIASKLGWTPDKKSQGMNPRKIASLRGLYDQQAVENGTEPLLPDNPTEEDLDKAAKALLQFRSGIRLRTKNRIARGAKRIDQCYDILRHAYSLHQRQNRISLLSALFSWEVDRLTEGSNVDRQSFVNGFTTVNGECAGGELSILEGVYNFILEARQDNYAQMHNAEKCFELAKSQNRLDFANAPQTAEEFQKMVEHRYNEYTKLLECWNELIPFVLKDLVKKEGVKMGIKREYAAVASSDSFGENDIAAKWDMSEAKRDGWMENSDLQSAFGGVGQQVRRILATVPQVVQEPIYETYRDLDGQTKRRYVGMKTVPVTDDLGNWQFMDAIKTHSALQDMLVGIRDSEDMLKKLCKTGKPGEAKIAWMQPIVDILAGSSQARTQFFCDFKHNFQPYSIMWEDKKEGSGWIKRTKTKVLNRPVNLLKRKYDLTLSKKGTLPTNTKVWGYEPVFDAQTKEVNWQRLAELRQKVILWTEEATKPQTGVFGKLQNYGNTTAPLINNTANATISIDGKAQRLTYDMRRNFLMEVFSSLGYDVTVDTIDSILNSRDIYEVRKQLEQLFDPTRFTGLLLVMGGEEPSLFRSLTAEKVGEDTKQANLEKLNRKHITFRSLYRRPYDNGNPVQDHSEKLLDIINRHQEGYRIESRVRYQGNTMYTFVSPSYLGDRLEDIKNYVDANDKTGLQDFLKEEYLQSPFFVDDEYLATNGQSGRILNMWLSETVDACKDTKTPLVESVVSIFDFERDLGREDKKFEDFTTREYGLDMLVHFFADEQQKRGYGGKSSKDIRKKLSAMYPVFILGDAGVSKYIRAPRIATATRVDSDGSALDEADANRTHHIEFRFDHAAQEKVLDEFCNIYLQERRRMALEEATALNMYANGKKVNHSKGEYSFLTFLNDGNYSIKGHEDDLNYIRGVIRQYLEDAAIDGMEHRENGRTIKTPSFKQRLESLGVLETVDTREGKVYRYISNIATPDNLDDKIRAFYWNTKLATAMQLQIMTLDPNFYHGTKDLQKRYKEIHAPGTAVDVKARDSDGYFYAPDGMERVVYFDDVIVNAEETNPEFMESIANTFGKDSVVYNAYKKNTLTDGQGYRTLTSYRRVMGMAGKWTRQMEEMYKSVLQIRSKHAVDDSEITEEERQQIIDYALVLQPIKPYMFTHEKLPVRVAKKDNKGNTIMGTDGKPVMIDATHYIPVQHKYAEALIIPELMPKGNLLRDLANWMEDNNVDMVGSTKIAKVGCFGQTNLSKVTDKTGLEKAMGAAYVHELPYKDYRIQTNVPEHINSSQLFGTQVRKLIMAGLDMGHDYSSYIGRNRINLSTSTEVDDSNRSAPVTGRNLLALYNSLICANILDSYDKFSQNAGDIEALADLLQQSTAGSMREAMDNLFSYVVTGSEEGLQKFMIPLFEGGLEHDAASLILSTFKKIVNKQQISGGSAVQVSALGIEGYQRDGGLRYVTDPDNRGNILYAEIEMPFDKSFLLDVKGANGVVTKQKVDLAYDKYCDANGYLIPTGEAIEKGSPDYKKYMSYTYKEVDGKRVPCRHDDPEAKVYKPLIEEEYPDMLSILAYRIPTERAYSMINCRIKRFTPKTAGGTIKVPPQGTSIAGFDFDIDKLYFMQREYHKHYNDKLYVEDNFSELDKYQIWATFYENNPEIMEALTRARAEAEADNPDLAEYRPIIRNGVDTGRRRTRHKTTLNSYWGAANIEGNFGKSKASAFSETAQAEGIMPSQNLVPNAPSVWVETYDFDKPPEENTRAARNNLLITIMQARLMDPDTMIQRYTPGGFDNASKAARLMRELFYGDLAGIVSNGNVNLSALEQRQSSDTDPEPNYDPTDPYTILVYNQQNQVAGKLIGIFANQNTNHAFASAMEEFLLNKPIDFCGHHNMRDLLHKGSKDAAQIDRNMAEFLAASVDAVKDPVLNFLNLNTATADAGAVLARLGYNTKEIGLLFNQPVIRKVCEDAFNREVKAMVVIEDVRKELMTHTAGQNINDKIAISENDLAYGIVSERQMLEEGKSQNDFLTANAKMQLAVLDLFSNILRVSQDVSDFVLNTKFTASNAVSSTFGGMYAQQLKVGEYVDKFPKGEKDKGSLSYKMSIAGTNNKTGLFGMPIADNEEYLNMTKKQYLHEVRFNSFAYEQAMYDANRKASKLLAKYFPYERPLYKVIRAKMQSLALFGTLPEDDINDIHSNIPVAILAKQEKSLFNGEATHVKEGEKMDMTNREYYKERFAADLADMVAKDPEGLGALTIFKYLYPVSETVQMGIDPKTGLPTVKEIWRIAMQDVGGMDADTKEEIRESWAYLMEVKEDGYYDRQDYAELGRDLFMYCFYQQGFDYSPLSFMHLAPTAVKDNITVERNYSLPLKTFDEIKPGTDDVLVWSSNVVGATENASDNFDANISILGERSGSAYQLPEALTVNDIRALIHEAYSRPELKYKIDRELSQEEFNLFTYNHCGEDVPSNIYFSQGTLIAASQGSKEAVSYGKNRTYRQLLNEILEGTKQDLNTDEFAQMWILNHIDNSRFVLDLNRSSKRLKTIVKELTSKEGNTLREGFAFRPTITLDISSYQNKNDMSALGALVSVEKKEGRVIKAEWCPCIKIKDSYYMAQSGGDLGFNVSTSLTMTYRKVEPWGTSKTIEYDGDKKLTPTMRYQTSLDAEVERVPQNTLDTTPVGLSKETVEPVAETQRGVAPKVDALRQMAEEYIFNEMVAAIEAKNGPMAPEDKLNMQHAIAESETADLNDTVADIRKACRKDGVMMLDDQGNPMMGC